MAIKPEDIAKLVELFEESNWDELHVEIGGMQLFLSTDPNARLSNSFSPLAGVFAPATAPAAPAAAPPVAPGVAAKTSAAAASDIIPASWTPVRAPNLGTFYRSPKPGAQPFVEIGDKVTADSEICLIEVMKLFTSVKAGIAGTVRKICANDSELVEGNQVLFYIEAN